MESQKTEVDLWEAERKATQEFTACKADFTTSLEWTVGAMVSKYMETLCASLVATTKARNNGFIKFGINQEMLDACRVAKLDCEEVLTEHLKKPGVRGTLKSQLRSSPTVQMIHAGAVWPSSKPTPS